MERPFLFHKVSWRERGETTWKSRVFYLYKTNAYICARGKFFDRGRLWRNGKGRFKKDTTTHSHSCPEMLLLASYWVGFYLQASFL
mgnify:CR=1 FL=1